MRKAAGWILLAFGILVAGFTGWLALDFVIDETGHSARFLFPALGMAVLFGALPFSIGIAAIAGGVLLLRRKHGE